MPPRYEDITDKDMQQVTVCLKNAEPATAGNYSAFFIAPRPIEVMQIQVSWTVASSSGTVQVQRLTGTTAPDSGSNIMVTAQSTASTANTVNVKSGTLLQNRILNQGDRLGLVDGGTLTNLANLVVTILYKPRGKGDYR